MLRWLRDRPWLALVALVVVNVVLLGAVLARQQSLETASAITPGAVPPAPPTPPATTPRSDREVPAPSSETPADRSSTADERSSSGSSAADREQPERLLVAASSTTAWRTARAACGERSVLEVTTDSGRTWRTVDPGVRGILRLRSYGRSSVFAVGIDRNCVPTYAWTDTTAGAWRQDDSVIWDVWYLPSEDPDSVHAPGGTITRPCGGGLVSFAATPELEAAAVCADGRLRITRPGSDWRTALSRSGAVALAATDNGFVLAQLGDACRRVVVSRFDATGRGLRAGEDCAQQRPQVAVASALDGAATWVWQDDKITVSKR